MDEVTGNKQRGDLNPDEGRKQTTKNKFARRPVTQRTVLDGKSRPRLCTQNSQGVLYLTDSDVYLTLKYTQLVNVHTHLLIPYAFVRIGHRSISIIMERHVLVTLRRL